MKFRLKKLYQTLNKSISAGAVKTVEEWTKLIPELWGSDLTKNFPDWFEKVSTLVLTTSGENNGSFVSSCTVDKFRYDGKRLTDLKINANVSSYEDVKELIQFLEVTKYCFQHTTYNELPRVNPLTPSDCLYTLRDIIDSKGKGCNKNDCVWLKHAAGTSLVCYTASYAVITGQKFFKNYADAKEYYGVR